MKPHRLNSDHHLAGGIFLRLLALTYLCAFVSFGIQADGLIGAQGILPLENFVQLLQEHLQQARFFRAPMVFHVNASHAAVTVVWLTGAAISVALFFGVLQKICLPLLYVLYLSLFYAGQVFMSFQWDILLLEAGFLAIFLPWHPWVAAWLFRWLLFRFMFLSGAVKLLSGDPTWANLTALNFHFETQPLPTALAWYAHRLPEMVLRASVAITFFIELVVPFFYFLTRRLRLIAAGLTILLELLILITGNYNFFNLLTIALCVFLIDDQLLARILPARAVHFASLAPRQRGNVSNGLAGVLATLLVLIGATQMWMEFTRRQPVAPVMALVRWTAPFHIVNPYGLFRVMTTHRPEIIIQGSHDGNRWLDYEFRYKPGAADRRPGWNTPHQPRLDWQMWFAALGNYQQNPWFANLMVALLTDAGPVTQLLARNPFEGNPPTFVRAILFEYAFTDSAARARTGHWWQRELAGVYFPAIQLKVSPQTLQEWPDQIGD